MDRDQNKIKVKIKLLRDTELPTYATEGSAAIDLRSAADDMILRPGDRVVIPTGIAIEPETRGVVAVVAARSGLGVKHGITLANGIGVIDSDYRGEIHVCLVNNGKESFKISRGDRIAQLMFLPVFAAELIQSEALGDTDRGAGGFGSTGIK